MGVYYSPFVAGGYSVYYSPLVAGGYKWAFSTLHSLQVAIATGKPKKPTAID